MEIFSSRQGLIVGHRLSSPKTRKIGNMESLVSGYLIAELCAQKRLLHVIHLHQYKHTAQ